LLKRKKRGKTWRKRCGKLASSFSPTEAHITPAEADIAVGRILMALMPSKVPTVSVADCQSEFEREYPELCERYHPSGKFPRRAFRSALLTNSAVSGAHQEKWQAEAEMYGFARDSPADWRRLAARFARMSARNKGEEMVIAGAMPYKILCLSGEIGPGPARLPITPLAHWRASSESNRLWTELQSAA
jgi:hypothetical protein